MERFYDIWTLRSETEVSVDFSKQEIGEGVTEYTFKLTWEVLQAKEKNDTLRLACRKSTLYCRNRWTPMSGPSRKLDASWRNSVGQARLSAGAPVTCIFNTDDLNTYTFAVSEILKCVTVNVGPNDGDVMECVISLPLIQFNEAENYIFKIYLDERRIPYYQALDGVRLWWEEVNAIDVMPVSHAARMPIYSTWYSYHYGISDKLIEEECRLAKKIGLEGVIVDDGWQVEVNPQGYAFCGDWEVVASKFPDMKAHVKKVHELGMKYMLWFSVPFVGKKSKVCARFEDKVLWSRHDAHILDPRYPEVREYLVETYERFVGEYDLDGLKLDFIDCFNTPRDDRVKEGMDYTCVQEATSALMTEVRDRLLAIRPDCMIEFRQSYVGPGMRRFGNMLRVGDCQNDGYTNHISMTDIRLIAGNTAVHSDMLTWDASEPVEDSALQVLDALFGVLQYSLFIDRQDEAHMKMSRYLIGFMKEHEELLQRSEFIPYEPQHLYPVITARKGSEELTAVYARDRILTVSERAEHFYLVNASRSEALFVKAEREKRISYTVRNCMGEAVSTGETVLGASPSMISVPVAGMVECFVLE